MKLGKDREMDDEVEQCLKDAKAKIKAKIERVTKDIETRIQQEIDDWMIAETRRQERKKAKLASKLKEA